MVVEHNFHCSSASGLTQDWLEHEGHGENTVLTATLNSFGPLRNLLDSGIPKKYFVRPTSVLLYLNEELVYTYKISEGKGKTHHHVRKFDMAPKFNQEKATAAAAFLLKLRGGQMSYLKLIKLLYLADREALHRWGFSITTDVFVSMDHGPVVSKIYDLITIDERMKPFWSTYISAPLGDYEVALRTEHVPQNQLSRAEEKLLTEIFGTYGTWDRWKLRDFTHDLPEWHDPNGSSIPIQIEEILTAQGASDKEIKAIIKDLNAAETANNAFGSRT